MAQVSAFARLVAQEGRRDEVVAALSRLAAHTESEEGTLLYAVNVSTLDDRTVWVHELYADQAALDSHLSSQAMQEAGAEFGPLLADTELVMGVPIGGKGVPA